ncbi:MAG: 5'-methylthioadenosine/adenosylhomocysteine nucleosidase [Alcaligenaceae bacterium]|nr:5'-methylthioadenosine/adenosylhomocysteine nucleosidase [Alcaligenaceae bacterium]
MLRIGIMAALYEEIADLLDTMESVVTRRIGMRDYHSGMLHGRPCVVVLARVGKVAAAATAVTLIREFSVDRLIFTGLAGGVAGHVSVGDVVIGTALLQHDLDASPLFPRHEIPLLNCSRIPADAGLSSKLERAAKAYLQQGWPHDISPATREAFNLSVPRVHVGLIVSGDQFVNRAAAVQALRSELPGALCVEMEGAAVAQVCHEYGARFAIVRTVSDRADDSASHDFSGFLAAVASHYSAGILRQVLDTL